MPKPLHISDIAWTHNDHPITPVALKGAIIVGLGTDQHHYVGRREGDTITTIAGPMASFDALSLALNDGQGYGGLAVAAVTVDEFADTLDGGTA